MTEAEHLSRDLLPLEGKTPRHSNAFAEDYVLRRNGKEQRM
jgi:hypothetical protein